jgi:hypothetical protein
MAFWYIGFFFYKKKEIFAWIVLYTTFVLSVLIESPLHGLDEPSIISSTHNPPHKCKIVIRKIANPGGGVESFIPPAPYI